MKTKVIFAISLLIAIGIILITVKGNVALLIHLLTHFPRWVWITGLILVFSKWVVESLIFYILLHGTGHRAEPHKLLVFTVASYMFHYITPFQSGGQAMQVVILSQGGMDPGEALSIVAIKSLAFQIGMLILLGWTIPYLPHMGLKGIALAASLVWLGTLIYVLLLIASPTSTFWNLLPIRRLRALMYRRWKKTYIRMARSRMKYKNLWGKIGVPEVIVVSLLSAVQQLMFLMPLVLAVMSIAPHTGWRVVLQASIVADSVGSLIPTPGASGGIEGATITTLVLIGIPRELAAASVSLWRLLCFYFPLLAGWVMASLLPAINMRIHKRRRATT